MQYFHWGGHSDALLSNIANLYKCGLCVDCVLCAEGQYLKAHKVILCASSPYLQSLLLQETDEKAITFRDITFLDLKNLVSFVYNGEIELAEDQVSSFISSAKKLQIAALPNFNDNEILESMKPDEDEEKRPSSVNESGVSVLSESGIKSESDIGDEESFPTQFEGVFVKEEVCSSEDESVDSNVDKDLNCEFILKSDSECRNLSEGQNNHFLLGNSYLHQQDEGEIVSDQRIGGSGNAIPAMKEDRCFQSQTAADPSSEGTPQGRRPRNPDVSRRKKQKNVCPDCKREFTYPHELRSHSCASDSSAKPFVCQICSLTLSHKRSFCRHQRVHTGEKPFACQYCGATFAVSSNYKRHVRCHTGEKPYRCDHCPAAFVARTHLVNHLRIHTGEKPYRCDICPAAFSERGTLKRHARAHLGQRPFACVECPATFAGRADLKRHVRLHTGEKPFVCALCPAAFSRSDGLKKHAAMHTATQPPPP